MFQPTDRLKTEEELARDERERLEKLEVSHVTRASVVSALTSCTLQLTSHEMTVFLLKFSTIHTLRVTVAEVDAVM